MHKFEERERKCIKKRFGGVEGEKEGIGGGGVRGKKRIAGSGFDPPTSGL